MIGNIYPDSKWLTDRLGCFTSSEIDNLLTEPRTKAAKEAGELSETAKSYINSKAAELITGTIRDFSNAATEWGELYEAEAADILKTLYPDMIYHGKQNPKFFPYSKFSGGSPDAVAKNTVFEIKCPENPTNHVAYCLIESADDLKKMERAYYHQIQMNMLSVAKYTGVDFMSMKAVFCSYCPIVSDGFMKIKTLHVYPEQGFADKIERAIVNAEKLLAEIIQLLTVTGEIVIASFDKDVNAVIVEPDFSKLKKL